MPKKEYVINGRACKDLSSTAAEFTKALALTVPWTGNLDAFDDFLSGGFGTPAEGFTLIWEYSDHSRSALGYPETIKWLEERIHNCHPSNAPEMQKRLETARHHQGETLFDLLVNIIKEHEDILLILKHSRGGTCTR